MRPSSFKVGKINSGYRGKLQFDKLIIFGSWSIDERWKWGRWPGSHTLFVSIFTTKGIALFTMFAHYIRCNVHYMQNRTLSFIDTVQGIQIQGLGFKLELLSLWRLTVLPSVPMGFHWDLWFPFDPKHAGRRLGYAKLPSKCVCVCVHHSIKGVLSCLAPSVPGRGSGFSVTLTRIRLLLKINKWMNVQRYYCDKLKHSFGNIYENYPYEWAWNKCLLYNHSI